MTARSLRVIVIGGGAAGFFGAITCAEVHFHSRVTLLEAGHQPLSKVRISGGGRCNVTHACFDGAALIANYPRGSKALRGAFSRFQPRDTIKWFSERGVQLKTEADGRIFPVTDDSGTIVKCLLGAAQDAGVQVRTGNPATAIARIGIPTLSKLGHKGAGEGVNWQESKFQVTLKSGEILESDRLLLATGSHHSGYEFAQALGHTIVPPVPSLFTFNIADDRLKDLAGVAVESVKLRLQVAEEPPLEQTGSLLITHWGLSGPAVLKLSAWGARILAASRYQATLFINWLPQYKSESLREQLVAAKSEWGKKAIAANCPISLPRRLWQKLAASVGIGEGDRWAELSNKNLNDLMQELTQGKFIVKGKGVFKEEFVTCGGANLKEVDFKTMESRICPGLYFAGEILDIDGITGGFNFQSAWTTAWIAGNAMGRID